jgi:hypothetical protein
MRVVITGPRSVGKSSVSKQLSWELGLIYVSSDELMEEALSYYGGLDGAIRNGRLDLVARVGARVVHKTLERDGVIFDLAGGSLTNQPGFSPYRLPHDQLRRDDVISVGLQPFTTVRESVELLFERERGRDHFEGVADDELREKVRVDYENVVSTLDGVVDILLCTEDDSVSAVADRVLHRVKQG